MRNKYLFLFVLLVLCVSLFDAAPAAAESRAIDIKLFHSPHCKACIRVKQEYLPVIISKYKGKISIEYFDVTEPESLKIYAALEKALGRDLKIPLALIGANVLIGADDIVSNLEPLIEKYILTGPPAAIKFDFGKTDLLQKFRKFSYLAIIASGLIDGINPCAFTVLIFFISFLTLMGYKYRALLAIGLTFILAVFLTYLAIGLGLFRGLYELGQFYSILKVLYYLTAVICLILAYLNLRDYIQYKRTNSADSFKVKLPKAVRQKINSLISMFYRPGFGSAPKSKAALIVGTFVVGFLVSLLEAVCTGQVYLPVIVFILKEPALRIRAITYLLIYNLMFIAPLLIILCVGVFGMNSKKLEEFFRKKVALVKLLMFVLFLGLAIFLLSGI